MCSKAAADGAIVVEELPSKRFWHETYEELVSIGGETGDSSVKVASWRKKPREPVAKGDVLLELEVAGNFVIEMRATAGGFMGRQLVLEGEKLSEGQAATYVTQAPEPLPHVSSSTESALLDAAGGSVRRLHEDLADLQARRASCQRDLADALRLASLHLGASPAALCGAVRVPGGEGGASGGGGMVFVGPPGVLPEEVTPDDILERGVDEGCGEAGPEGAVARALLACPGVACLLLAQTPAATALSLTRWGVPGVASQALDGGGSADASALRGGAPALIIPGLGVMAAGGDVGEAYCRLWEVERTSALRLRAGGVVQPTTGGGGELLAAAPAPLVSDSAGWFKALKRGLRLGVTPRL